MSHTLVRRQHSPCSQNDTKMEFMRSNLCQLLFSPCLQQLRHSTVFGVFQAPVHDDAGFFWQSAYLFLWNKKPSWPVGKRETKALLFSLIFVTFCVTLCSAEYKTSLYKTSWELWLVTPVWWCNTSAGHCLYLSLWFFPWDLIYSEGWVLLAQSQSLRQT